MVKMCACLYRKKKIKLIFYGLIDDNHNFQRQVIILIDSTTISDNSCSPSYGGPIRLTLLNSCVVCGL